MKAIRWVAAWMLMMCSLVAHADGQTFKVATRPGVETSVYWEAREDAKATVFLFTGGNGGYGKVVDGKPSSRNFLARSVALFLADGFNVAIFGLPSDTPALDYSDRVDEKHLTDVRAALEFVRTKSAAPIWLVGTSRGTISATYVAIGSTGDAGIAGLVLTSSVTAFKKRGAVPAQNLAALKLPVLVVHHASDACPICQPHEMDWIMKGLKNAPVKKLVMVTGGGNPSGDVCEAMHYHGFIGQEKEVVDLMAEWMKNPVN
ncbi:pimeloyl-ACP methyl ester carboxylesterase [Duganella sp. 1411]|uniref:alpha/beta hydrolase n=1 Tax=Duganella sp. 1411 TaxID=2806572 RepID=UPI001B61D603|nr:alpha/beta hydrolase [Duganella sp. 1411]MBP1207662.1 pimeloyl-ACP methyl ester carboxylesterase [Duganella sp. 1411]